MSPETTDEVEGPERRWLTPGRLGGGVVILVLGVLVAVRLGSVLLGHEVFGAMDLLGNLSPWRDGGPPGDVVNNYASDSIDYFLPAYLDIHERLWSGDLPLATDLTGPGNPLLADSNRPVLGPTTFWFLLLPTAYASGIVKLTELVVAVAGMALWLRRVGVRWPAGLLAGLAYCGTGFVAAWSTWVAQAAVAALIPAMFWVVERFLVRRTVRSVLPVAAVAAFLVLGGFPAVAGQAIYVVGLYFLVRLVADRHVHSARESLRTLVLGAGGLALGLALSAVQLLPLVSGLSDVDLSGRAQQFSLTLSFRSVLSILYPTAFADSPFLGSNVIESYAYLGLGVLVLGVVAVLTRRGASEARGVVPFLAVALVFAASLIWYQGWWNDWVGQLPVFSGNPIGRLRAVLAVLACGLAGIGADRVLLVAAARRDRVVAAVACLTALGGFGVLTYFVGQRYAVLLKGRRAVYTDALWALATVGVIVVAVLLARRVWLRMGAFAVLVVLLALQVNSSVSSFWPITPRDEFYPQLAVVDALKKVQGPDGRVFAPRGSFLGSTASAYDLRTVTAHAFQPPTWVDLLTAIDPDAYGPGRSYTNPALSGDLDQTPQRESLFDRLGVTGYYEPPGTPVPGRTVDLAGAAAAAGSPAEGTALPVGPGTSVTVPFAPTSVRAVTVDVVSGARDPDVGVSLTADVQDAATGRVVASGQVTQSSFAAGAVQIPVAAEQLPTGRQLVLALRSSAPLTVAADPGGAPQAVLTTPDGSGTHLVYADTHGTVWSRTTAMPRIRWADSAQVVTDPTARLATLADPSTPRDEVVLSSAGPLPTGRSATVTTESDDGDRIGVSVDAAGGGYLVVADSMQTGWRVSVDGEAADLVDADHAFSGVWVPTGQHDVVFSYVGNRLEEGAAVTVAGLVVVVAVLVWVPLARRRRGAR